MDDEILKPEVFKYLDDLRESGDINMFGAALYILDEFTIEEDKARELLGEWMKSF